VIVCFPCETYDEKEIEHMVVEKKKHDIISKYTSEDMKGEQVEAKEMFNFQ
jgi:pre-mRNA-splicing factor ISY1